MTAEKFLSEEERLAKAEQEKKDTIKEAEMLKSGGKYEVDEKGNITAFTFSPEQREVKFTEEQVLNFLAETPRNVFIPNIVEKDGRESAIDSNVSYVVRDGLLELYHKRSGSKRIISISNIKKLTTIFNSI